MKISYITLYNALDVHKWSGLGYFIAKALERQNSVLDYIDDRYVSRPSLSLGQIKRISKKLLSGKDENLRTVEFVSQFSRKVGPVIKHDTDIVFSPGSIALSLLKTPKKKVFYTDATFASLLNFYNKYTFLPDELVKEGHFLEKEALNSCSLAIYSSDWAAQSAINFYKTDPQKVKVVPFGANIEHSRSFQDIKQIVSSRSNIECNLLFIGMSWERKGGDLAVKVAKELNSSGLRTKLHVVGIKNLKMDPQPDFVINHGFISKSTEEGKLRLEKLFSESHFLIVPSRAEAYGLVFCESSSFGLPSLTTNVGGIPTVVKDDVNGKTFSLEADEKKYAEVIRDYFYNYSRYVDLAYSSFNEYEKRLNWDVAGKAVINLMENL